MDVTLKILEAKINRWVLTRNMLPQPSAVGAPIRAPLPSSVTVSLTRADVTRFSPSDPTPASSSPVSQRGGLGRRTGGGGVHQRRQLYEPGCPRPAGWHRRGREWSGRIGIGTGRRGRRRRTRGRRHGCGRRSVDTASASFWGGNRGGDGGRRGGCGRGCADAVGAASRADGDDAQGPPRLRAVLQDGPDGRPGAGGKEQDDAGGVHAGASGRDRHPRRPGVVTVAQVRRGKNRHLRAAA